jgi:DNA-binding transcriptional MocR family regulator
MSWKPVIQPEKPVPLHIQIRRSLSEAVRTGALVPGERLHDVRSLAHELKVNRLTVLKAIRSLNRSGLLTTVKGKGVFVASSPRGLALRSPMAELDGPFFEGLVDGTSLIGLEATPNPDGVKAILDDGIASDMISFTAGFPPAEAIPTGAIRLRLNRLLRDPKGPSRLSYGSTQGEQKLREEIRALLQKRGLYLDSEDHILITVGAQQGLALCLETLLKPGQSLAIESPGYLGAIAACRLMKIPVTPIPVDCAGINPRRLESTLRRNEVGAIYTVPNFQNPTGVTQSMRRRRQILELAKRHDVFVIEDDVYGDLRFGGRGIPPIKSLPGGERVVYVGSFSKSLAPGLRLGFIVASGPLADDLRRYKEVMDLSCSVLMQALTADLLQGGFYRRHLVRVRKMYRRRRDAMVAALERFLPPSIRFTTPKGGLHLWVMLDHPVDVAKLNQLCHAVGVSFAPGSLFFSDARRSSTFRLNYASHAPHSIEEGVRRLAGCLAQEEGR